MANLIRYNLIIEGPNVQRVLEFIGFMQPSALPGFNNGIVLIDLYRLGHHFDCEWPMPYGAYHSETIRTREGEIFDSDDLLELTANKVSFTFYTKGLPAQQVMWALSEQFPEYKFTYKTNDVINGLIAGEVLEGGKQTVFVDVHGHKDLVPEVMTEYPLEEYITLAVKPCPVPDCAILFPRPTEAELNEWRQHAAELATKNAVEVFQAEEAK